MKERLKGLIRPALKWAGATLLLGALALGLFWEALYYTKPTSLKDFAKVTVMVTNLAGNSGGSGVILSSSRLGSFILTNAHVCAVVENGGLVADEYGNSYLAMMYKKSNIHDMCLIKVQENLRVNTKVANDAPDLGDEATVAGHPSLFPQIITRGHFSRKMRIHVMTGERNCTQEEMETDLGCAFFGVTAVVKMYNSQVISPTIAPGSSGSPVFNSDGEIAGLVFAGNGRDIGYGFIVNQEYVYSFINYEINNLKWVNAKYK